MIMFQSSIKGFKESNFDQELKEQELVIKKQKEQNKELKEIIKFVMKDLGR